MSDHYAAITTALLMVILCACIAEPKGNDLAEARESLDKWMGRHKAELLLEEGAPTRVTSDGIGGEILIYEHRIYLDHIRISIYANQEGIIYFWRLEASQWPTMTSKSTVP